MVPDCQLHCCLGGRVQKQTMASVLLSVWEKAVPQLPPQCQIFQFLPLCHQCPLSFYSTAGAQREWVCISPCVVSLRGTLGTPAVSSTDSFPTYFCNQKAWECNFLALEAWASRPRVVLQLLTLGIPLLSFYPLRVNVGEALFHISAPHISLYGQVSLIP